MAAKCSHGIKLGVSCREMEYLCNKVREFDKFVSVSFSLSLSVDCNTYRAPSAWGKVNETASLGVSEASDCRELVHTLQRMRAKRRKT